MYMNGTHQDTPHDTSRYIKIHQDTYRIGNYTKSYRKLHVTLVRRAALLAAEGEVARALRGAAEGEVGALVGRDVFRFGVCVSCLGGWLVLGWSVSWLVGLGVCPVWCVLVSGLV